MDSRPPAADIRQWLIALMAAAALTGAACGGSGSGPAPADPNADSGGGSPPPAEGSLFLGFTDAEGDFLSYTVDVLSLTLERADGAVVEALPLSSRIDFAQYTELTELVTAASVPAGTYVGGSLRLDYSNAEVFVDVGGEAVAAELVDEAGNLLGVSDVEIVLDNRDRLVISIGRPALMIVDFDLNASHEVDTAASPPVATVEPFILAEINPVDSKQMRLRGTLRGVDQAAGTYNVNLLPFFRRDGSFGDVTITTGEDTAFEVDAEAFAGADGLDALEAAGAGTPTIAYGTLLVGERRFEATEVLAGSSVPWSGVEAVRGNVVAREGDQLTVLGATIVSGDGLVVFNDEVLVTMGPETRVLKFGDPGAEPDLDSISIGQRIRAFGELISDGADISELDATAGRVRILSTRLAGVATSSSRPLLNMELQSIDGRDIARFDFAGSGAAPELDADPYDYEIATGNLTLAGLLPGAPVWARGFMRPFGTAPEDFDAGTVIDFSNARAALDLSWTPEGTAAPFLSIGEEGIVPDLDNPEIGRRHSLKLGGIRIDLLTLEAAPTVVAADDGRLEIFAIREGSRITMYREFSDFVTELAEKLDGATLVRSFHASGGWNQETGIFTATRINVALNVPQ